ncbi:MAG: hypothetical protein P4M00_03790 [Azospirillaceae bacterium]|nr:hypothetical protein [Azospirillaceae bacterium]
MLREWIRNLPSEQLQHIVAEVRSGRGRIGALAREELVRRQPVPRRVASEMTAERGWDR